MYKNNFGWIWKSNSISFNKTLEELKTNFRVIDEILSEKHDKPFIKYEYTAEKSKISINWRFYLRYRYIYCYQMCSLC